MLPNAGYRRVIAKQMESLVSSSNSSTKCAKGTVDAFQARIDLIGKLRRAIIQQQGSAPSPPATKPRPPPTQVPALSGELGRLVTAESKNDPLWGQLLAIDAGLRRWYGIISFDSGGQNCGSLIKSDVGRIYLEELIKALTDHKLTVEKSGSKIAVSSRVINYISYSLTVSASTDWSRGCGRSPLILIKERNKTAVGA